MTEARTIPPIREGLARALSLKHDYREDEVLDYGDGKPLPAWHLYVQDADAVLAYLRSRHLLNDIALTNIKDEEASRAGEGV